MKILQAITIWADIPLKNKDATYSIQLLHDEDRNVYLVQAQFGRRGAAQKPALLGGKKYHYEGASLTQAQNTYNALLAKKRSGGYNEDHALVLPSGLSFTSGTSKKKTSHARKLNEFMKSGAESKKPFGLAALWKK